MRPVFGDRVALLLLTGSVPRWLTQPSNVLLSICYVLGTVLRSRVPL